MALRGVVARGTLRTEGRGEALAHGVGAVRINTLFVLAIMRSALLRGGAHRALWQLVVREALALRNWSIEHAAMVPALLRSTTVIAFAKRTFRQGVRRFETFLHGLVNIPDALVVPALLALTLKRVATLRALRQHAREAEVNRILGRPNTPSIPALTRGALRQLVTTSALRQQKLERGAFLSRMLNVENAASVTTLADRALRVEVTRGTLGKHGGRDAITLRDWRVVHAASLPAGLRRAQRVARTSVTLG